MNEIEIWRDILGYVGAYQVSNLGNIKSLKDNKGNTREKIIKQNLSIGGYSRVTLAKKSHSVHRLVAQAFLGLVVGDRKILACHKNDIRHDNRVENLFLGTHKDNTQDMMKKGRLKIAKGENHCKSKLTDMQAREIRKNYKGVHGEQKKIAKQYGVDPSAICYLLNGITWKTV